MTSEEALECIKRYAKERCIILTAHARERMQPLSQLGRGGVQGLRYADIRHALMNGRHCRPANPETSERWKVDGPDLDGDDVTLVVVIEEGVIVITVM